MAAPPQAALVVDVSPPGPRSRAQGGYSHEQGNAPASGPPGSRGAPWGTGAAGEHATLVYELVQGAGTLEERLFGPGPPLPWQERVRICCEVATVLAALHCSDPPITHGAVAASNILLDASLRAKLSVGLAAGVPEAAAHLLQSGLAWPSLVSDARQLGAVVLQALARRRDAALPAAAEAAIAAAAGGDASAFDAVVDAAAGPWPREQAMRFARAGLLCASAAQAPPHAQCSVLAGEALPELQALAALAAQHGAHDAAAAASTAARAPPLTCPPAKPASAAAAAAPRRASPEGGFVRGADDPLVDGLFTCPITQEVMADPVVAADGVTYERAAIARWLANGHNTSPMTNLRLSSNILVANLALKSAISEWRLRNSGGRHVRPARHSSPGSSASSTSQAQEAMELDGGVSSALAPAVHALADDPNVGAELRTAASKGDVPLIARLLGPAGTGSRSADPRSGWTALHFAAQRGSSAAAEMLLNGGAAVDAAARDGVTTPLLLACMGGHHDVVLRLLSRGARAQGAVPGTWGPLHAAAACNREGVVELLLHFGASAAAVDARSGQTPQDAARRRGHTRVAALLAAFTHS